MTVKSLGAQLAEMVARKQPSVKPARPGGGFQDSLSGAVQQRAAATEADQARMAVELARLQMMRGALSLEAPADSGGGGWSDLLATLAGLTPSAPVPQAGQKIDPPSVPLREVKTPPAPVVAAAPPRENLPGPVRVPREVESIIDRASRRYGVDPALIKAVIKAESSFNQHAVSPVGAQGLMQLMPGTAGDLGVKNPFDAEQNVMGGTRYLKGLLEKYDGHLDKALAAYNWGPGNVDRRGIETLPRETRNYLVKVKRFYDGYST